MEFVLELFFTLLDCIEMSILHLGLNDCMLERILRILGPEKKTFKKRGRGVAEIVSPELVTWLSYHEVVQFITVYAFSYS